MLKPTSQKLTWASLLVFVFFILGGAFSFTAGDTPSLFLKIAIIVFLLGILTSQYLITYPLLIIIHPQNGYFGNSPGLALLIPVSYLAGLVIEFLYCYIIVCIFFKFRNRKKFVDIENS
jgi:hypothetical protein